MLHVLWVPRKDWNTIQSSIASWPETYKDWEKKLILPDSKAKGPRNIQITHAEPEGAQSLQIQVNIITFYFVILSLY